MPLQLDHLILPVNDRAASVEFYFFDPNRHLIEIRYYEADR